ncbi:hypothetical protein KFU94_20680 [Chloroflexi bacterium TSY]|nr:hypothetical protein [Chloroflexi bacterium TSY]
MHQTYSGVNAQIITYGHYHAHHILQLDDKLLLNVACGGLGWYGLMTLTMLEYADGKLSIQQHQVPFDMTEHEWLVKACQMLDNRSIWYWRDE